MAAKFMRIKRIVIPFISLVILTSQLSGCEMLNEKEVIEELEQNTQVEVVVPEPGETIVDTVDEDGDGTVDYEVPVTAVKEEELGEEELAIGEVDLPPVNTVYITDNDLDKNGYIDRSEWDTWVAAHPEDKNQDMRVDELDEDKPVTPPDTSASNKPDTDTGNEGSGDDSGAPTEDPGDIGAPEDSGTPETPADQPSGNGGNYDIGEEGLKDWANPDGEDHSVNEEGKSLDDRIEEGEFEVDEDGAIIGNW